MGTILLAVYLKMNVLLVAAWVLWWGLPHPMNCRNSLNSGLSKVQKSPRLYPAFQ